VFLECAGEMANFIVNNNPRRIRFIVFYEEIHEQTISPVAKLYMEMSGIIALKYTPGTNELKRISRLFPTFATYFRKYPKFIRLGRPLLSDAYKTTSTQLYVDCIARNNFITARSSSMTTQEVQFIAAKCQLYKAFSMDSDNLDTLYNAAYQVDGIQKRQRSTVLGCYRYAQIMYRNEKTNAIAMEKKTTAFLSFNGSPKSNREMERVKFDRITKQESCRAFLPGFIAHFHVPREKQEVCGLS